MPHGTKEDKDDIFIEDLNTALLLLFGILALVASVTLFGFLAISVVYSWQFSTTSPTTPALALLSLAIGLGAVHQFRKRRQIRKEKNDSFF